MKFSNLKVGQVIKNYKELCSLLEIEHVSNGNSKIAIMKEIDKNITYKKVGHKFKIMKIHPIDTLPPEKRPYIQSIEDVIVDMLYFKSKLEQPLLFSANKFFRTLEMINGNYTIAKSKKEKLSYITGASSLEISDFFDSSRNMMKYDLGKSLRSLSNKAIITHSEVWGICELKEGRKEGLNEIERIITLDILEGIQNGTRKGDLPRNYRKATQKEAFAITRAEKTIMKEMGVSTKSKIGHGGTYKEFIERVGDIAFLNTNNLYYFPAYEILPNVDAIKEVKSIKSSLSEKDLKSLKKNINEEVSRKVIHNSRQRHRKSLTKQEIERSYLDGIRSSDDYVETMKILCDCLLDQQSEDISKQLMGYS